MCGGYTGEHEVDSYSGTYTYEGHDVNFTVMENGMTMEIQETKDGKVMPKKVVDIVEAIDYQDQLIDWGYVSF
tara:strand:- start:590 stop:808 length:219 start_codon:yes stop_codon:yes gene_type:complete